MRAIIVEAPGQIKSTTVDEPTPGPREVLVAVSGAGICGTDLHIIDGDLEGTVYPIVPGHEFAGTVAAVGSQVTEFAEGDRVAVDPNVFCGECHYCKIGRGNLCERYNALGVINSPGAAAEFCVAPVANCFLLPENVSLADAPLIEPLSCAVHGFDLLPGRVGEHYLIYGAGTMGLMMAQLARFSGAASVSVVDLNADRLGVAADLAADRTATEANAFDRPQGWEVVIDCTGAVPAIEDGLRRVRKGGTFQVFGVAPEAAAASFSPFQVYKDEIHIVGSMAVLHSFGRAVELMGRGVLDPAVMTSHRFGLDEYADAIDRFRVGVGRKLQITPGAPA
ncbi:zinc-dependent alcohol dehydrogenase family protein [Glycomyces sp. TRM65418]|uniref:zinc-dependent alcohol dehydrogenase family protein n=1 Tax=Glycomyces sp. TRM65418 TaxID=2867006 RepID=UPI001CE4C90C|nr:zinc-dependent alcohol dehydrogenase family protein [Glycomyces sp. TRM65418]MCC3764503.1 zinc-dependent alcohol dehydrogenase family protein [Glycomyces sp. TRM65418]QZD54173.1 zinc-dependent alcohol dehydrogenase family protein [Glycomyces sp. TRM65418]